MRSASTPVRPAGRGSGHLAERLAKAREREREQHRADHGEPEERLPDDRDARAAKQDRLSQLDEVRGGRGEHDVLHELGHAFARRAAAREHLQRQQHEHEQHAELRHAARERRHEDAHRGRGEQMQRRAREKQRDRSFDRHMQRAAHDERERERGGHQHHDPHRPDLRDHDLGRRDRHHQQMLDGAVLALAYQRRARENDGEHRHVVDDFHQRAEPRLGEIRIEAHTHGEIDGQFGRRAIAVHELRGFVVDHLLDVAAAGERLAHARGVDVELHFGCASGEHVALQIGRNVQHEGVIARVHAAVGLRGRDHHGRKKVRREERLDQSLRERRDVVVDHGDGRHVQRFGPRRGRRIDHRREREDDEDQQHRVAREAPELLHAEAVDVGEMAAHVSSPAS
ncbi:hypothetical protein PT2222_230056 [Paraburkholderia tropica]